MENNNIEVVIIYSCLDTYLRLYNKKSGESALVKISREQADSMKKIGMNFDTVPF